MEIDRSLFAMMVELNGGVITTAETAIEVAEALIKGSYGEEELAAQRPLKAEEEAGFWILTGSRVPEKDKDYDGGPVKVILDRHSGQVIDISATAVLRSPIPLPRLKTDD
jgi:hypothetical protein